MRRCLNCMSEYQEKFGDTCPCCGYAEGVTMNGEMCLRPGTILQGRYIVGTVKKTRDNDILYIGWDALFDRRVLIQEYFPRYCATRSAKPDLSIYDSKKDIFLKGLELFNIQSRELIRLYKERDIITYHSCFGENQTAYGVMDYREERTLRDLIEQEKLEEEQALALLRMAVQAMDKVHRIGVCHGMIDLDTFWVARDGSLILKDFGAWRYISGEPGVVNYGKAGPETDVYGLARLFCQMVTGKGIEDGDNLEMDLLREKVSLDKETVTALKHALSHETKSLYRFRDELGGRLDERAVDNFHQNRSKRRDAKDSLYVPQWLYLMAGIGLAGVAVAALLLFTGVIRPHIGSDSNQVEKNMVRVPNVVGREANEGEALLKNSGLEMSRDQMVYSKDVDPDIISYQEIKENTMVERGTEIVVWISKGEEKGVIPSVEGLQREEAEKLLKEAGFNSIRVAESKEEGVYNSVQGISEKQGENVALNKEIVLTVCVNQKEQTEDKPDQQDVPDLTGMERADAQKALESAGFLANWAEEASDKPRGTILKQEPAAGEKLGKGEYITIYVCTGPAKIYMKNVQLMSFEEARREIEGLGGQIGRVTEEYSDSIAPGKVISQSIKQDAELKKGDSIDLAVSKGKNPATQQQAEKKDKPKKTTQPAATQPAIKTPPTPTAPPETKEEISQTETEAETVKETRNEESSRASDGDKTTVIEIGGGTGETSGPSGEKNPGKAGAETVPAQTQGPSETPPAEETTFIPIDSANPNLENNDAQINTPPSQP